MENKQMITINENQLIKIVEECVKTILNEQTSPELEYAINLVQLNLPGSSKNEQIKMARNIVKQIKSHKYSDSVFLGPHGWKK